MDQKTLNIYKNLEQQIKKIAKHNRQGSFKTKERYLEANKRFCKHLAENFKVQKFCNIQDKHLESYVKHCQERGLSASTIKTDLGAIRFYHDKTEGAKYSLSGNDRFDLAKRSFGGVDRSWTQKEYSAFKEICQKYNQERVLAVATLARNEGLRIHETFKIDRASAENAFRTDYLHIVGKGGKEREVPLSAESKELLKGIVENTERGNKLFVEQGEKTHLVIKQVQNFINRHREQYQADSREHNLTFHGLRHSYAHEQYQNRINQGLTEFQARKEVSQLLGHERDDVTRIYINTK